MLKWSLHMLVTSLQLLQQKPRPNLRLSGYWEESVFCLCWDLNPRHNKLDGKSDAIDHLLTLIPKAVTFEWGLSIPYQLFLDLPN